ncbi:putative disease resistance RPP13-like protein 1 [Pistacia vera]|uniref:putative disease resistance RPP13-like protein 1 n=1 Tax=Pistacia vera TaxID=55513 RepID=UPI0012636B82|nr:putative disease resistance RPP13-like protein 1 [Pistacia vera]
MAEIVFSVLTKVLLKSLASMKPCEDEFHSELKHLRKQLLTIQPVLNDAEEKQVKNVSVKKWLDDTRNLAYDAEDFLDVFSTPVLEWNLALEQPRNIKLDMKSKIEEITGRLEDICEEKNELGLKEIAEGSLIGGWQRPPSTSVPTEAAVVGRDDDKAKILDLLLKDEPGDANFCVIGIWGMGGLGKTTLVQKLFNDQSVEDFPLKSWVCVSHDFDVLRISKTILESVTCKSCDLKDLNEVQVHLRGAISGRKFLVVLDDVWSTDYGLWQILKSALMGGVPGSRMIVTTRSREVALTIGNGEIYSLKLLSDDDCWRIFENHVGGSRVVSGLRNLELIREKVVERCRGLPLAARTLGGLLRHKQRGDEWVKILDSKLWDLSDKTDILPVLKLSYDHLPCHLKSCFAYLSIFPKKYKIDKEQLVHLWMGDLLCG